MVTEQPGLKDTSKLLEANLFHHKLITRDELAFRSSRCVGKALVAR